jgi:hypothetical protein
MNEVDSLKQIVKDLEKKSLYEKIILRILEELDIKKSDLTGFQNNSYSGVLSAEVAFMILDSRILEEE